MTTMASVSCQGTDFVNTASPQTGATTTRGSSAASFQESSQAQATMQQGGQQRRAAKQMTCLYTKQKTQKRKRWQDGRLVLHSLGASLYDAHPPPGSGDPKLDECQLTRAQCDALIRQMETNVETEKYLIQVEGPWRNESTTPNALSKPNALVSEGMKKVITRKFRKPGAFVPPMQQQQQQNQFQRTRQRQPLQPGELRRRYYGNVNAPPQQPGSYSGAPPAWNHGLQQQGQPTNGSQQQPVHSSIRPGGDTNPSVPTRQFQQVVPRDYLDAQGGRPPFSDQARSPQLQQQQGQHDARMAPSALNDVQGLPHSNAPNKIVPPQQVAAPLANSTRAAKSFARNQFNPNNYYGEDEECSQEDDEEEDRDGELDCWSMQAHQQANVPQSRIQNGPTTRHNTASGTTATTNKPSSHPKEQSTRPMTDDPNESKANSGAALSTTELLKLFGANPVLPVAAQEEGKKTTSDSKFEFVLPPAASDSSSDEDSD